MTPGDMICKRYHHIVRQVADHVVDGIVPSLRCHTDLCSDLTDLLVHAFK